jgi:hypothetical protein
MLGQATSFYLSNAAQLNLGRSDSTAAAVGRRWSAFTYTGVISAQFATSVDDGGATATSAYAFALNDFAFANNGSLVGTDSSGALTSPASLYIGSYDGTQQWFNGHIAGISFYNARLPNARLQALTA